MKILPGHILFKEDFNQIVNIVQSTLQTRNFMTAIHFSITAVISTIDFILLFTVSLRFISLLSALIK